MLIAYAIIDYNMYIDQNISLNKKEALSIINASVAPVPVNEELKEIIAWNDRLNPQIKKGCIPSSELKFEQGHEDIVKYNETVHKKLTPKEKKQLKDQIKNDGMVTCAETIATTANKSLGAVMQNSGNLSGLYKTMNEVGNLPFVAGKGLSTAIMYSYKVGHKISPVTTEIIAESIKEEVAPIVKTLPKIKKAFKKDFPKTYSFAGKAISFTPIISSAGFAIYDTMNAKDLIKNQNSSSETKGFAVATASLSYISTGAAATLAFADKFGKAAPKVAAVSSGLGIITFVASIYTSVKMEWSKNKDGI